jgi:hypothetical protein
LANLLTSLQKGECVEAARPTRGRAVNSNEQITLLLSWRNSPDNQRLWQAAVRRGWIVERVRGGQFPAVASGSIVVYIEALFAPLISSRFKLQLAQTPESWLPDLPSEYRHRDIRLTTLEAARASDFPLFVKPPNEKSFPAQVYAGPAALPTDYDPATCVLVSSPVTWVAEFRCFCLDGLVRTMSPYLRHGQLCDESGYAATAEESQAATEFAQRVLRDGRVTVPRAIVLDVGIILDRGWAVVEANAAWGAGLYGCDPDEVLNVLEHAAT